MNVLIACEESQRVCIAFRKRGFNAYSCDIQQCSGGHPEWHIQGDCLRLLNGFVEFQTQDGGGHYLNSNWDLIIAHPPCTYLSNAGIRWFNVKRYGDKAEIRKRKREKAALFFMRFVDCDCSHVCIENPKGWMSNSYRKPDCVIQPYFFSNGENDIQNFQMKTTCLWLHGLPLLQRTYRGERPNGNKYTYFSQGMIRFIHDPAQLAKMRSKTFPGVADAMAKQWGDFILSGKTVPKQLELF